VLDIAREASSRERLLKLGYRLPNVVLRGDKSVVGKDLDAVADLVGVPRPSHVPLPADQLVQKWIRNLRAAQRFVRQIPDDQILTDATPVRRRPLRLLGFHIFAIGTAFVDCAADGAKDLQERADAEPRDGTLMTGDELARHGEQVIARIEAWWTRPAVKKSKSFIRASPCARR
jgi:hypothetical protein